MTTKKDRSARAVKAAAVMLIDTLSILGMCLMFFIIQAFKLNQRTGKDKLLFLRIVFKKAS